MNARRKSTRLLVGGSQMSIESPYRWLPNPSIHPVESMSVCCVGSVGIVVESVKNSAIPIRSPVVRLCVIPLCLGRNFVIRIVVSFHPVTNPMRISSVVIDCFGIVCMNVVYVVTCVYTCGAIVPLIVARVRPVSTLVSCLKYLCGIDAWWSMSGKNAPAITSGNPPSKRDAVCVGWSECCVYRSVPSVSMLYRINAL